MIEQKETNGTIPYRARTGRRRWPTLDGTFAAYQMLPYVMVVLMAGGF